MSIYDRSQFSVQALGIPDEELHSLRMNLYHSSGSGFVLLRNFVPASSVAHMRGLWTEIKPSDSHLPLRAREEDLFEGCPDYYSLDADNRVFYNFLYNSPVDEVTWNCSMCVQMLRNRLSGRQAFAEIFPTFGRAVSYRVVVTRNSGEWIGPHRDWISKASMADRGNFDLTRLQATLFLSEKHVDYEGTGFRFETNSGSSIVFGSDVEVRPGDLAIWRYNNLHSVTDVKSHAGQLGFMRIIFPPERVTPRPGRIQQLKQRTRRKAVALRERFMGRLAAGKAVLLGDSGND